MNHSLITRWNAATLTRERVSRDPVPSIRVQVKCVVMNKALHALLGHPKHIELITSGSEVAICAATPEIGLPVTVSRKGEGVIHRMAICDTIRSRDKRFPSQGSFSLQVCTEPETIEIDGVYTPCYLLLPDTFKKTKQ